MNVYVLQLARELGRRGYHVDVYTRIHDPNDPEIVELGENARVVHIKAGACDKSKESLYLHIPEFITNLYQFQRSERLEYDLVHSHYWLSGWAGTILSKGWGVPQVATFHTLAKAKLRARAGEKEPELRSTTEKRVMDNAQAIVVSTRQEAEDLSRLYEVPSHKVEVVPAGVDLEMFRPLDKAEARRALGLSEQRVILYVGRVEPLKGLGILVEAVAQLEEREDTRLLVVGGEPGEDRQPLWLKSSVEQLGIGHMATFVGAVEQSELPTYYAAADVLVLPSYYESFGLVALEAMACGRPVIASRVGGPKTFLKNGETGYLIPWRCPEPFAERLHMLLANESLGDAMGIVARTKAEGMGWSGMADQMLDLYSYLVEAPWESVSGA